MGKWNDTEIEKLKLWYQKNNVPSDQLIKDRDVLDNFTEWFNTKFGCDKTSKDIADQLLKLRKKGLLPRLRQKFSQNDITKTVRDDISFRSQRRSADGDSAAVWNGLSCVGRIRAVCNRLSGE